MKPDFDKNSLGLTKDLQTWVVGQALIRQIWEEFYIPSNGSSRFADRLGRKLHSVLASLERRDPRYSDEQNRMVVQLEAALISADWLGGEEQQISAYRAIAKLRDKVGDFNKLSGVWGRPDFPANKSKNPLANFLTEAYEDVRSQTRGLDPSLIGSVKEIYREYMIWIKKHPKAVRSASWEAFEEIVAEVLASHGYRVELTGRRPGASGDILAIRSDELGVDSRYLVECKRYSEETSVGLDIVNSVLGAATRAQVDHALLVTTGRFSRAVKAKELELRDLRLHIRDGEAIIEWLRNYRPMEGDGIWIQGVTRSGSKE